MKYTERVFAALSAVNETILRAPSENVLFQRVCDTAVIDGPFVGAVALLAEPDNSPRVVARAGAAAEVTNDMMLAADEHFAAGQGRAAPALLTGSLAATNDCLRMHSCVIVPIKKEQGSIGAFVFHLEKPDAFDEQAVGLLIRMAENISFTFQNFEREKQHIEAARMAAELSRMYAALSATNEAIMRAETREALCQLVCEAAVLGGNFTHVGVALAEQGTKLFQVIASAGAGSKKVKGFKFSSDPSLPEGRTLSSFAVRTKQPCVSNDWMADDRSEYSRRNGRDPGSRSGAAWPLFKNGEAIGVLSFWSVDKDTFTADLVDLLQRLADNISFALANFDRADEKTRADEQISYLAAHDGLTGLPNRASFSQLLNLTIETSRRHKRQFALLFIDLDRFKIINDTLGHAEGDLLLIEMGRRLRSGVRSSDIVARLGGDEFVIILQEIADSSEAIAVGQKLLSALMAPLQLRGQECRVTASIGAAAFPIHGDDEKTLVNHADVAMYVAKEEGKNGVRLFDPDMKSQSIERLMLESGLRHALERNELVLHYQPKRELATGNITGVEALLRWDHPDLGLLAPNQFIPLAEETGLIVPIGRWVLKTACVQNVTWQHQGIPPMSMAVNLSPRQFMHDDLLEDIGAALVESGMPPEYLELEITESMMMNDVERAVRILRAIKSKGVRLAMDDFGTGYSSMSLIKQFPVDVLKIDRSFVRDLAVNSEDKAITNAVISLGKALGLTVVAEGVETAEQESFLRNSACNEMQGFLFSKALPAEEIPALLQLAAHASPPVQPLDFSQARQKA